MAPVELTAYVCKYLRADANGVFRIPLGKTTPPYAPDADADIGAPECFDLLSRYCCAADAAPSWRVFRAFISTAEPALNAFQSYSDYLHMYAVTLNNDDVKVLSQIYFNLLLETAKHFSLRSVPREAAGGAIEWVANAKRFDEIDHPLVMWMRDSRGRCRAIDFISPNPAALDRWFAPKLKSVLISQMCGEVFKKDWQQMSTEEGVTIVQTAAGMRAASASAFPAELEAAIPPPHAGYVVTVDTVLKMLAVALRLKNRLPVVVAGTWRAGGGFCIRCRV